MLTILYFVISNKRFHEWGTKETGILLDLGHLQISCKFYELDAEKELDKIW